MNIKLDELENFLEQTNFGEATLMCSFQSFIYLLKDNPNIIEINERYVPFIKTKNKKFQLKCTQNNIYKDFRIGANDLLLENIDKTCLILIKIVK